ncbi:molybdate ABC transporter substrate-binding protein [Paenibacillus albicereus]|uniref:Molybdate ABC transporter substrate-binding protein n=1 Tax=Paenibacillus albicereus TaxID=2726185 RepID=A0A6H2GSS9_9BACL|nr:molybdate ABC transporter substrate-binding protein [Paenibacillus albicereus]QJC50483.1 molybdate ABC transporter substrate-binding protein [Paenibacillus albicereus]
MPRHRRSVFPFLPNACFLLLALALLLAGCGQASDSDRANAGAVSPDSPASSAGVKPSAEPGAQPSPAGSERVRLTVSAAASLTEALGEIETSFEAAHPTLELNFNFGASGTLQKQIEQGAPVDLFISASGKNMKALADAKLVDAAHSADLLANKLVLVVSRDSQLAPSSLDDLTDKAYSRIAVGIPESVPAGQYAKQALDNSGLWDALEDKLVQAKDVKAVLQMVETGNAEAGFVYETDALGSDRATLALKAEPASYSPILYPAAVLAETKHPEEAAAFYEYLRSSEAMDVFLRYGFSESP